MAHGTPAKEFVDANQLVRESFILARQVYDSGYRPDVLIVLWRGGTPVGIVVHEFLRFKGMETYHTAVKAESYVGIDRRVDPCIEHLDTVLEHVADNAAVLVVDDIFDTGRTLAKVIELMACRTRRVKIATLYVKDGQNQTDLFPDYYVRRTDRWVVFPHELMDLTPEDLAAKDPAIQALLE